MPLIEKSSYRYKGLLFNEHLETIVPALIRKVNYPGAKRSRMRIMDGDFLDIDFYEADNDRAVIISHGLEGSSQRSYVLAMARVFYRHGWDVAAWNFRGCSEEMNRKPWFYHSGATNDLHQVISIARKRNAYRQILLVGFSLGGNLTLKYLGENIYKVPDEIIGAVTFSVPLDLAGSSMKISQAANRLYSNRFLRMLKKKTLQKNGKEIDKYLEDQLRAIKTLREFDEHFTAPLHGFKNAAHYYYVCSSLRYLSEIKLPVLIVNAHNDPFLSQECLPFELCRSLENVYLEVPERGGHMGFAGQKKNGYGWMEQRALTFARQILDKIKNE
ncbi:MAG: alpha/beta fold hydrolase [Cyclobacteriaceae bacterium]|nr:alpha/beta fold hydrolase [Cyclobacteriaceae bacterium]